MNRILYIFSLVLLFASCEEYFVPDIDPQESVFVFQGLLTDEAKVHKVGITESVAFDQDASPKPVSGFNVYIEDDLGRVILFMETQDGVYESDDFVAGEIGRSYRLVATNIEGETYISSFEPLVKGVPIDTINGKVHYETILKEYKESGFVEVTTRGMLIMDDVSGSKDAKYHRYEYDVVFQSTQYYPFIPFAYIAYIARPGSSYNQNYISLLNCNLYGNYYATNNPVEFIDELAMSQQVVLPDIEYDEEGEPIFEPEEIRVIDFGILINIKQHSLSDKGFNFWNAIYAQQQSTGQLFDPVESQIVGNMYKDNDTTALVLGYFGASSINIKGMHLKLRSDDKVDVNSLIYFPELETMIDSNAPFDFWVY